MKYLFFLLVFPVSSVAQTIHFEDNEILYTGTVNVQGASSSIVTSRLQEALYSAAGKKLETEINSGKKSFSVKGMMTLQTPFHILRHLHYTMQLTATDKGYTYRIDDVYVKEKRRGGKFKETKAKELLEGREETGAAGAANEILLNEIDLRFQKLLALLEKEMSK